MIEEPRVDASALLARLGQWMQFPAPAELIDVGDCWIWRGSMYGNGYGRLGLNGRTWLAHRLVWAALVGPIPRGKVLDHMCHNPPCVNPDHLRVLTTKEHVNARRVVPRARDTHCRRGHEFDRANTYWRNRGGRQCRACERITRRAKYWARRTL